MNNKELKEIIEELLKQPEGLKFDFKVILHIAECTDKPKQDGFRSEFIRDILALVNGNIGTAGQTAYLIVGAADKLDSDGKRKLQDSSHIRLTSKEILQKINSCCHPPIPDVQAEFVDVSGKQLFIISIPPTPYLHETTQDLKLPNGKIYPRNSIFVRHGEEIDYASIAEIDSIRLEKDLWQRNLDRAESNGVMSLEEREYLESIEKEFQKWWESYDFINDSNWIEFGLNVEISEPKTNNKIDIYTCAIFAFLIQSGLYRFVSLLLQRLTCDGHTKQNELPILEALRQFSNERVLIVGKPGAGKSTILAQVLLRKAEEALQDSTLPIPVLIKLKDCQHQPNPIWHLMKEAFKSRGFLLGMKEDEKLTYIENLIKDRRLLLLADGVNELPSEGYKAFKGFCDLNLPMILTTRDIGAGDLGIQTKLEIKPLSPEEVKDFLIKKLPDHHNRVQELCDRVRDFGQTPLMVWMLYSIFKKSPNDDIPQTRGVAYRKFTTIYVERAKEGIDLDESKFQLSNLAFEMIRCEQPIYESKVQSLIGTKPLKHLLSNHLLQWDGMLGSRKVQFCHQSLQEYYAAEYILAQLSELTTKRKGQKYTLFQTDYLNHLKWTEAITIMLGFPEIDNRAEHLVELALDVDLMLGARLAGELKSVFQQNAVANVMSKFSSMTTEELAWLKLDLLQTISSKVSASHLVPLLDHPNRSIRNHAYLELLQIDPNIIPEQCRAMKDSREIQQMFEAVRENEEVKEIPLLDPQIVEYLDPNVRKVFGDWDTRKITSLEVIEQLAPMLQSPEVQVRWSAVKVLGSLESEVILPFLLQAIEDPDSSVNYIAGIEIGYLGFKAAIPRLVQIIEKHQNPNVRCSAVRALKIIGSDEILSGILRAMQDPDVLVCQAAVEASERINSEELIPALLTVILHLDPHVRRLAAHRLSNLSAKEVLNQKYLESLVHELENSDIYVRWYIAFTLWYAASEKVIPLLLPKLNNQNPDIRLAVAFVLGQFGCQEAVPELIRMMDYANLSEHPDIQNVSYNAAYALGQVKGDAAAKYLPELFSLISSPSGENVFRAITAIQLNCGFYNYEIADLSESETQKTENFYLSTQGLTIMTDKQPIINFNQNNATIGVNYAAENSNIKFQQNVNITEQDLAIAAQKIQAILNQLSQNYPTNTEIQKQDFIHKFLERIESTPDLIKVILAGGIEWVKALYPLAGIPIEMSRSIYEAVKKRHNQS